MSVVDVRDRSASDQDQSIAFFLMLVVGLGACVAMSWPAITDIWRTGVYRDTDDAMRMVQVRDWLAGQGWYDLRALRLDPPTGTLMHWSRLVDLPVAGLIRLFGLFADQATAERLPRIVFPIALQGLLLVGTGLCGRLLAGSFGGTVAILLTIASGMSFGQFVPGRIDHHAPQIVLLVFMVYACLCGLDPQRPRMAALAGLCAALSLAIAIENLPFILVLMAVFPVAWALQGAPMRGAMVWMGAGFAASLLLVYGLFQSPALWTASACDALSAVHIRAALSGGAAMGLLAAYDRWRKPGLSGRIIATALVGLVAVLPLILDRQCFIDPFSAMDPLVRRLWLANVREARTIAQALVEQPQGWGVWVMSWAMGAAALVAAVFLERGLLRTRYLALLALTLAGCATALYMIRSVSSVAPLALLGGVWAVARLRQACGERELLAVVAIFVGLAPFTPLSWILAVPIPDNPADEERSASVAACLKAEAFAPLQGLPAGPILALPDLGPFLLIHTKHSVIAGPYHRNNHGNRLAYDAFMAPPPKALEMLRAAGVRHMAICQGTHVGGIETIAADGLAAALAKGEPPYWARPVGAQSPLRLFEIVAGP